jgi:hypothetical protein
MRDAYRRDWEKQVVITDDSGLAEPIHLVRKDLRMPVAVVNPHPPRKRTSRLVGDGFRQIRPAALARAQLPAPMKDTDGPVCKPQGW